MVMHTAFGAHSFVQVDALSAADLPYPLAAVQARRHLVQTAGSRDPTPRKRIFSKTCYWEFLIPGGKPLRIDSASGGFPSAIAFSSAPGLSSQCNRTRDAVSFTPQGGKDYQVGIYTNDGVCTVMVHEVKTSASETELLPIALD